MGNWQDAPAARDPAEEPAAMIGHVVAPPPVIVKFVAMVGLLPGEGTGKVNGALPKFSTVMVCGLSGLVEPTGVEAKVRLGASARSSFKTRVFEVSTI
jgi:hypothetical protein